MNHTKRPTTPAHAAVSTEPGVVIGSLDIGSKENGLTLAARYITGGAWVPISDEWYDGAKWSRRETPADPFEEVVT